MKRNYTHTFSFAIIAAMILTGFVSIFSQKAPKSFPSFAAEVRTFDFNDDYYYKNGVEPSSIYDRRTGVDLHSVFDSTNDARFRNVRIRSVFPAYSHDGKTLYWNLYGELYKHGFQANEAGREAIKNANTYPLYIFPNRNGKTEFRQAHLINLRDDYFQKNLLGLSVQVLVEFTDLVHTEDGREEMAILEKRNGVSIDGTPIIKTLFEIEDLTRKNLVTQRIRGLNNPAEPSFAIAKVIENPQSQAIAPDSILLNNLGLSSESIFVENFECLKTWGRWCGR